MRRIDVADINLLSMKVPIMSISISEIDIASMLQRFDTRSPEKLIRALAEEFVRLHRAHTRLEARLATMETLSAVADQLLDSANRSFDYPKTVKIDAAASSIELVGVHQLEHTSDGMPFRWTGPERHFSIQFFVSRRQPAIFNLRFGRFFADVPVEQLRAFVDGDEVPLSISGAEGGYEARGELPPREKLGGTVLTFVVPALAAPSAKGYDDVRLLGLLFVELAVAVSPEIGNDERTLLDDVLRTGTSEFSERPSVKVG